MTVALSSPNFFIPEMIKVAVARTPGGPTTDTLIICTGIANANFLGNADPRRDTLEFAVPNDDGISLNITGIGGIVPGGSIIDSSCSASLASINGGDTMAVDTVDCRFSDPDEGLLFLEIALAASNGNTVNRIAYQVHVIVGPPTPPIG